MTAARRADSAAVVRATAAPAANPPMEHARAVETSQQTDNVAKTTGRRVRARNLETAARQVAFAARLPISAEQDAS